MCLNDIVIIQSVKLQPTVIKSSKITRHFLLYLMELLDGGSYTNGIYYKLSIHSYLANEFE